LVNIIIKLTFLIAKKNRLMIYTIGRVLGTSQNIEKIHKLAKKELK